MAVPLPWSATEIDDGEGVSGAAVIETASRSGSAALTGGVADWTGARRGGKSRISRSFTTDPGLHYIKNGDQAWAPLAAG